MVINFIVVGQKMPKWVQEGYTEYSKRLPKSCSIKLIELPMATRGKTGSAEKYKQQEEKKILEAIPKGAKLIALDENGSQPTTVQLSEKLADWLGSGQDIALIVGGPDGLLPSFLQQVEWKWSLSKLTLPHPMVRIIVAEQIYRAWSILQNHPYHRQ